MDRPSFKNPNEKKKLPETNSWQPEHRPSQKEKSSSNHPFSGANMLVSGSVRYEFEGVNKIPFLKSKEVSKPVSDERY